jgi:hypothetical protein
MRSLLAIASLAASCLYPASASAGLIFELDGIDAHHVDAAAVRNDRVTVASRGRTYTIRVPDGAGASLLAWARDDTGGPLVFSMDGSLVSTDGNDYRPPSVPLELGLLLFSYDGYAHEVACGATHRDHLGAHPLVQAAGEEMLPYRMHEVLLDPATRTAQAYSYRRLTERFVAPPQCVGELSLYAVAGTNGKLVSIQPRSWIHMVSWQWYRDIDVPSEADRWVARLPYQPLKQDMERRWTAYRAAFTPLDSLSSIVEAMAMLRAIKRDAPAAWAALEQAAAPRSEWIRRGNDEIEPHPLNREPWQRLTHAWIGERVDTPAEANLALGLAITGDLDLRKVDGLEGVAARDPFTEAKLELAFLLFGSSVEHLAQHSHQLFQALSQMPHSFRLRAKALFALEAKAKRVELPADEGDALEEVVAGEKDALVNDFVRRAESACASRSNDLVTWESLSQDVYSVGLLNHLRRDDGRLPPRIAAAVACIHFRRGMAPQQGRELAYRHAHYRFLKYLAQQTDDRRTLSQILQYRRKLAGIMNLHDSDLGDPVQP